MALDRDGNELRCQSSPSTYLSICVVCENKIVIHCQGCGVQISGCLCTLADRIEKETSAQSHDTTDT